MALAALAAAAAVLVQDPALVRPSSPAELAFPPAMRFPLATRDGGALDSRAFEQSVLALAREPLAEVDGEDVRFADLVLACREASWQPRFVERLLAEWEPRVTPERHAMLRALLDCRDLYDEDWSPDDADQRAGFLFGPRWTLAEEDWRAHSGDDTVLQSAYLCGADMLAVFETMRQWDAYPDFVDGSYEELKADPSAHLRTTDAEGRLTAEALKVRLECDLPFPLTGYAFDLRLLFRVEEGGVVRCWYLGEGKRLHWYAGYDLYVPLRTAEGTFAGLLQLRQMGVDLRRVPEDDGDRRAAVRTILGNLRLRAEKRFAARGEREVWDARDALPVVPLVTPLD